VPDGLVLAPIVVAEGEWGQGWSPNDVKVYADEMNAELHGVRYRQWVYRWTRPGDGEAPARWYWLRVTLDSLGMPIIWETLDPDCARVEIYASYALEERALEQFGPPREGRTFGLERAERDGRGGASVALVRLLDVGPVPMGPMVYVGSSGEISTIACRCMASQVKEVLGSAAYALAPGHEVPGVAVAPAEDTAFLPEDVFDKCPPARPLPDPQFLERALRLPAGF
jgi:hypothetical protein